MSTLESMEKIGHFEVVLLNEAENSDDIKLNNSVHAVSNANQYSCKECNLEFKSKHLLEGHLWDVHYKLKDFSCVICSWKTCYECDLINHMLTHGDILNAYAKFLAENIKRAQEKDFKKEPQSDEKDELGDVNILNEIKLEEKFEGNVSDNDIKDDNFVNDSIDNDGTEIVKYEMINDEIKDVVVKKKMKKVKREKRGRPRKNDKRKKQMVKRKGYLRNKDVPELFKCDICNFSCKHRCIFLKHQTKHSDERPFACDECQYRAKQIEHLRSHQVKHQERSSVCEVCGGRFRDKTRLKDHLRSHSEERLYRCAVCPYACKDGKSLKIHTVAHEGSFLECDQCNYKTTRVFSMKKHRMRHVAEGAYRCSDCSFSCKTLRTLKLHAQVHQDSQIFNCSYCGYKSVVERAMKSHMRVHLQDPCIK